jgi:hypothetical protein
MGMLRKLIERVRVLTQHTHSITCFYGKRKHFVIECILEIISLNLLCKYLQIVVLYLQEE